LDSGFKVHGSWFRVQGSRFRFQGSWFKVQGSGFRVQGSGFRVQISGFSTPNLVVGGDGKNWRLKYSTFHHTPQPYDLNNLPLRLKAESMNHQLSSGNRYFSLNHLHESG